MSENIFNDLYSELDDVSKLISFKRKNVSASIRSKLVVCEEKIGTIPSLEQSLDELLGQHKGLESAHNEMVVKNKDLESTCSDLLDRHKDLEFIKMKHDFVTLILSAERVDNEAMRVFNKLVEHDFLEFANQESSLAEEAKAILMLQVIQKEVQLISDFSAIFNKNIVAVGGGFSAGKSEFISSFFADKKIKLPIGINPVTAIPTYVTGGESHVIKGYSYRGGSVEVSPELYKMLSHDFIKSLGFSLKEIVPVMAIETKMDSYDNICFIDTPGYNPTNTGTTDGDHQIALEYLESANALLWVIGLDASDGAIPASDLAFLEELSLEDKPLFVIANKADLKSPGDLEDILDSFEDMLDECDIEYSGISAYNSLGKEEIAFRKESLVDFLQEMDCPVSVKGQVMSDLNKIFDMYKEAINEQLKWTQNVQSDLHSLELDFMQDGMDIYESERAYERLEKIRDMFETGKLKGQLKKLQGLREKMTLSLDDVFSSMA